MKVKELIARLSKMPQDLEVYVCETFAFHEIKSIGIDNEVLKPKVSSFPEEDFWIKAVVIDV